LNINNNKPRKLCFGFEAYDPEEQDDLISFENIVIHWLEEIEMMELEELQELEEVTD